LILSQSKGSADFITTPRSWSKFLGGHRTVGGKYMKIGKIGGNMINQSHPDILKLGPRSDAVSRNPITI